jgi:hypothetical protein
LRAQLVFGSTEGVWSRFRVLRSRTYIRRFQGRRFPFSYFAHLDTSSTVSGASSLIFIFYAPRVVFGGIEGVGSHFYVLHTLTHFRRYRGRRVSFLCFAHPYSFSAVPRASGPIFMFCAPGLVFDGAECVVSRFHVLRARTNFRRYRGRPISFSCIPLPKSCFHVFRSLTCFWRCRERRVPFFMFCASGHVFGGTEDVNYCFHILRFRTRFRRYGGCRVLFSCFLRAQTRFRR